LPEQVDVIISEPMFPSRGVFHVASFNDEALYMEHFNKVNFWYQEYFHGVTAPTQPLTHWYQPIFAKQGHLLTGRVQMVANAKQSFDLTIEEITTVSTNTLDLKNPYFM